MIARAGKFCVMPQVLKKMCCTDQPILKKEIKGYANNKPWVIKEIVQLLNTKKEAVAEKDKARMREIQSELKKALYKCKVDYKPKWKICSNPNIQSKRGEAQDQMQLLQDVCYIRTRY